jgi:hypothetical protein
MAQPRTLILSDAVPSDRDVGGIWLRDWLSELVPVRTSLYALDGLGLFDPQFIPDGLKTCIADVRRRALPPEVPTNLSRLKTSAQTAIDRRTRWPRLLREAIAFAKTQRIEQVWAVLELPVIYYLAPRLARALNVPLITTVWDPPESVLLNARLDRFSRNAALRDFDEAMQVAVGGATMSPAMQVAYAQQYDTPSVILRHVIDPDLVQTPQPKLAQDSFTIGFSGSLYARNEWRALVAALQERDWQLAGRPVRLRMLSARIDEPVSGPVQIEWLGWRSACDAVQRLSECDLLYLPYWFDPARKTAVDYCFPSKLTTYMAAGRPTLYHGPESGSPMQFAREHPVLAGCHTLESRQIAEQLECLLTNTTRLAQMRAAIPHALDREFTRQVQRERLAWLLKLPAVLEEESAETQLIGAAD